MLKYGSLGFMWQTERKLVKMVLPYQSRYRKVKMERKTSFPLTVARSSRIAGQVVWRGVATQELRTRPEAFAQMVEDLTQEALTALYDWEAWEAVLESRPDLPMRRVPYVVASRAISRALYRERKRAIETIDTEMVSLYRGSERFVAFGDDEESIIARVIEASGDSLGTVDAVNVQRLLKTYLGGDTLVPSQLAPKARARARAFIKTALSDCAIEC